MLIDREFKRANTNLLIHFYMNWDVAHNFGK
jgi:hypothetical protein